MRFSNISIYQIFFESLSWNNSWISILSKCFQFNTFICFVVTCPTHDTHILIMRILVLSRCIFERDTSSLHAAKILTSFCYILWETILEKLLRLLLLYGDYMNCRIEILPEFILFCFLNSLFYWLKTSYFWLRFHQFMVTLSNKFRFI